MVQKSEKVLEAELLRAQEAGGPHLVDYIEQGVTSLAASVPSVASPRCLGESLVRGPRLADQPEGR